MYSRAGIPNTHTEIATPEIKCSVEPKVHLILTDQLLVSLVGFKCNRPLPYPSPETGEGKDRGSKIEFEN